MTSLTAMDPPLAVEAMRNMHVYVLAVIAVSAVIAGLFYMVRSRQRSAKRSERDESPGA